MTEEQIFLAALEIPDQNSRTAYLDSVCGNDTNLRNQVEELLSAHFRTGEFLDQPVRKQLGKEPDTGVENTILFAGKPHDVSDAGQEREDIDTEELNFLSPSNRADSLGRLGHYEVLQVIGKGGFGIVLRAFDESLHRVIALKVLAPALAATSPARKRFLREARASARVRHENVVQVHAVEESPLPYLVMEFIGGETLQQRLNRIGPLEVEEIISLSREIAEGLAAAHATGLIHRDIKPGNILIEGGTYDRVKITDFGLARAADDASLTQSGIVAGTPMFMAPEQAQGESFDHRADLFSLGSVMYTMACGRPPFRAATTFAVLKRVVEETPRPIQDLIPEVPKWLCEIISKLHAKNPDDRFQSARELADLLAECEEKIKTQKAGKYILPIEEPAGKWSPSAALSRIFGFLSPQLQESGQPKIPARDSRRKTNRGLTPPARHRGILAVTGVLLIAMSALAVSEFSGMTNLFGSRETKEPIVPDNDQIQETVSATQEIGDAVPIIQEPKPAESEQVPVKGNKEQFSIERTAALPGSQQIKEIRKELVRLNPGFDGKITPTIENEVVTEISINTDQIENIEPIRALTKLVYFDCRGTYPNRGKLSDLSPLKGMKIKRLDCSSTQIADLSPIADLPLAILHVNHNPVSDLTPLKKMPLESLGIAETKVSDLRPLKGKQIKTLGAQLLPVTDLSPLEGMPLTGLDLYHTIGVTTLESLKGMPLVELNLQDVPISDLSPLSGMTTLRTLVLQATKVADLSPLSGLKLTDLLLYGQAITDLAPLKGLPLSRLTISGTGVSDLTPLKGMPLAEIHLEPKKITQGIEILRSLDRLKIIGIDGKNSWPPEEFWKRYDQWEFN